MPGACNTVPFASATVTSSGFMFGMLDATRCTIAFTASPERSAPLVFTSTAAVALSSDAPTNTVCCGIVRVTVAARDGIDRLDRLGQLALQRALVVDVARELVGGDALLVEQRERVAARGDVLGAEIDARLVDHRAGHHDRATAAGDLVLDVLGVERGRDRARVLRREARVERCVVGLDGPLHERHAREHHGDHAEDRHGFLTGGEAVDESLSLFLEPIHVDDGHQICIPMIWLNDSTARSRTATVISVVSCASVAAIV